MADTPETDASETDATLLPAIPGDALLDPVAWRDRTHGALRVLRERLDVEIAERRRQRGDAIGDLSKLSESDVAPLVRDIFGVSETLRHLSAGFKEAADHLDGAVMEEVEAVIADHDRGRIVVSELGTDIVAGWNRGSETEIDWRDVDEALAAMYHKRLLVDGQDEDVARLLVDSYRAALRDVRLYAKVEYGVTKLKALKQALQGSGDDDIAGMVERSMHPKKKDPKFTVKREESKARR